MNSYTWYKPKRLVKKWSDINVNTFVGVSTADNVSPLDWCDYVKSLGRTFVAQSSMPPAIWAHNACVGVLVEPDEPNAGQGAPNARTVGQYFDLVYETKRMLKSLNIRREIWVSLSGENLYYEKDDQLAGYIQNVDVISFDWYLFNTGLGYSGFNMLTTVVDRLEKARPIGTKLVMDIETGPQRLNESDWLKGTARGAAARPPTEAELMLSIAYARMKRCECLYFTDVIGNGWLDFDGTPDSYLPIIKYANSIL